MRCFAKEELEDPSFIKDGKIEIYYPPDYLAPYKERRSNWSFQFAANMENFFPSSFISKNDGLTYKELFGSQDLQLTQVSLGTKYNFSLGALTLDLIGGYGKVARVVSVNNVTEGRELVVTKKAISFGWTLDAIMKEPYVAPYIQGHIMELDYQDKGDIDGDSEGRTGMTTGYTLGLLIQLNSVDPTDAALTANKNWGLNNTFLDIFATQYNSSEASDDPEFRTSLNWGAGLRFEF